MASRAGVAGDRNTQNVATELYADLLRKAKGDRTVVARWIAEISSPVDGSGGAASDNTKDLDAAAAEAGAPATFFCPISFKLLRDPIMLPTGHSYERRYIERWLEQGNMTCPVTGTALTRPVALTPNVALRKSIEDWAERHAIWLLGADGRIKPIPEGEDFAAGGVAALAAAPGAANHDALDRQLALRLQQEDAMLLSANTSRSAPRPVPVTNAYRPGAPAGPPPPTFRAAAPFANRGRVHVHEKRRWTADLPLWAISLANLALFITAIGLAGWRIVSVHTNPMLGPSQDALVRVGALDAGRIVNHNQYWRLLSSPFTNAGIISEVLNASLLWTLAKHLEPHLAVPWLAVPLIYFGSGVIGSLASANLDVRYIVTGASNAICGIIGGVAADQLFNWGRFVHHLWTAVIVVACGAIYIVLGFFPYMDNFGHIFGMGSGFLLTVCLLRSHQTPIGAPKRRQGAWRVTQIVCALLLALLIILGVVGLKKYDGSVGTDCGGCASFSCVSKAPHWTCETSDSYVAPSCTFVAASNGTTTVTCVATGVQHSVNITSSTSQAEQCSTLCPDPATVPPPPPAPPVDPNTPAAPPPPPNSADLPTAPSSPGSAPTPGTKTVPVDSSGGPINLG